ncbi:MAG TPA: hypothetical protein VIZ17_09485 [Acetobacteraceae bacterium]
MSEVDMTAPVGRRDLLRQGAASAILATAIVHRHALAADVRVAIENFAFSPTPLAVAQGTTVIWRGHIRSILDTPTACAGRS